MKAIRQSLVTTSSALLLVTCVPAIAQEGVGLEEIVVTATRREETLTKVPISISAYSQEQLDVQGMKNIDDLVRLTPGVSMERSARYNSSQSNITIRGVRSTSGIPTTGIYIDDTPVQIRVGTSQSAVNPYPRVFDLERIEVLRGPQGTLFGAGSVGGAVRFITPPPDATSSSLYVRSEASFTEYGDPSYEAGVAGNIPLVDDRLALRASVWQRHDGGWVDRVNYAGQMVDDNANDSDATVARIALGWQPVEGLTITPSVFYQRTKTNDTPVYVESISDPDNGRFRQNNPLPQPSEDEFYLPAVQVNFEFGDLALISNTSYFVREVTNQYDATSLDMASQARIYGPPPAEFADAYTRGNLYVKQKVFTQEVRLQNTNADSRFNWVVGAFYSKAKLRDKYGSEAPFLLEEVNYARQQNGQPLCATLEDCFFGVGYYNGIYALYLDGDIEDEQLAAFAQVDYNVTDKLKLTVGARYADYSYEQLQFRAGTVIVSPGATVRLEQSDAPVTPKFGISYQLDDDNMFYGNVSRGYRVGAAATPVGARCAADAAAIGFDPNVIRKIEPDTVWSYEVGGKNRLFDGRVQLDASIYYIDWKDVQTILTLPGCSVPTTLNLGDARSQGADIAVTARVTDDLLLGLAVAYNDSEYTTTTPGTTADIRRAGEPLGVAPWTVHFSGQYDFMMLARDAYARFDYSYSSHDDTPLDVASPVVNPDIPRTPVIKSLDLRFGVKFGSLDLSLFAQNVTNEAPEIARYEDTPPANYFRGTTLRPRTVGLTAVYRY